MRFVESFLVELECVAFLAMKRLYFKTGGLIVNLYVITMKITFKNYATSIETLVSTYKEPESLVCLKKQNIPT